MLLGIYEVNYCSCNYFPLQVKDNFTLGVRLNTPEKYVRDHNNVGFLFEYVVVTVTLAIRLIRVAGVVGGLLPVASASFVVDFLLKLKSSKLDQLYNL